MRFAVILSLVIGAAAIIFAVINPLKVTINFGFFSIEETSLPLVLIATLLMGFLIGYLAWLPKRVAAAHRIRVLERSAHEAESAAMSQPEDSGLDHEAEHRP